MKEEFLLEVILEFVRFFCVTFVIFLIAYIIASLIRKHYKKIKYSVPESFATLIEILHAIIELEINVFETNIFSDREGITNSNFSNYYTEMCNTIRNHLSDDFMEMITVYVTEEFVYTLIARKVKAYLVSKIK